MIAIPPYLDQDAWLGFVEMRTKIKKPLTTRAAKMILTELQKLKDAGHDPNASLDQSTNHCWCDVWQPRDRQIQPAQTSDYERTQRYLREDAQLRKDIRRVS